MASFTALRAGLATRLATITGLSAYNAAPGSINEPAAIVQPAPGFLDFDATMGRGSDGFTFLILLLVSKADDEVGQAALDAYLDGSSAKSIKAAIEGGSTLGGIASYAVVSRAQAYGLHEYAGIQYLGCEFVVEVVA